MIYLYVEKVSELAKKLFWDRQLRKVVYERQGRFEIEASVNRT